MLIVVTMDNHKKIITKKGGNKVRKIYKLDIGFRGKIRGKLKRKCYICGKKYIIKTNNCVFMEDWGTIGHVKPHSTEYVFMCGKHFKILNECFKKMKKESVSGEKTGIHAKFKNKTGVKKA